MHAPDCYQAFPIAMKLQTHLFQVQKFISGTSKHLGNRRVIVNSSVKRVGTFWAGGTRGLEENGRWRYNLSFSKFLFRFFWLLVQISAPSLWEILRRILVIIILQNFRVEKKTCSIKVTLKELRWSQDVCHRQIRQEFHHLFLANKYSFPNLTISYLAPALVHLNVLRTSRGHVHLGYCWWWLSAPLAGRQGDNRLWRQQRHRGTGPREQLWVSRSCACLCWHRALHTPCLLVRCLLMLLCGCCQLHREIFISRERDKTCKYSFGFFFFFLSFFPVYTEWGRCSDGNKPAQHIWLRVHVCACQLSTLLWCWEGISDHHGPFQA